MSSNSQQGGRRNKLNEMLSVSHTGDLIINQWWATDIHSVCLVHRQVMKANIVVVTIIVPVVLLRFSIWAILFSALSCNNNTIKHSATHTTFLLTLCAHAHARTHARARAHLMSLSLGLPGWAGNRKVKPIWILVVSSCLLGGRKGI